MNIMYRIFFLSFFIFFNCKSSKNNLLLRKEISYYEVLDLSNKSLTEIPDLSNYTIRELNLSHNKITLYDESKLPKGLSKINISHNKLNGYLRIESFNYMDELNISNNRIDSLYVQACLKKINASYNNLTLIHMGCFKDKGMDTLNISHNVFLDNIVRFNPRLFKKIIRNNIKNKKSLIWSLEVPIID